MTQFAKNDITGKRFGRLVAISFIPCKGKSSKYLFRCDCGNEKVIFAYSVIRGLTKSCGCLLSESTGKRMHKHGNAGRKTRTATYGTWSGMMDRCEWGGNKKAYAFYGAKGIRVCERWHSFENFLEDMGEKPKGRSIDRIDNNKGYSPENCRWATREQQDLNTSRTVWVLYKGQKRRVYDICEELGLSRGMVRSRAFRRNGDYVAALVSVGVEAEPVPEEYKHLMEACA